MEQNIILIGFMGSGKTTNGRRLARKLNMDFIDTDSLIEEKNKISIEEIFKRYGEKYFRKLENETILSLSNCKSKVISTGGGIILNHRNIDILKENGIVILLESSVDNICNNLKNSYKKRPLIQKKNWKEDVRILMKERKELYENSADITVNVDGKKHNQIVNEICCIIKERA